jgi:hypothetical protein
MGRSAIISILNFTWFLCLYLQFLPCPHTVAGEPIGIIKHTDAINIKKPVNQDKLNIVFSVRCFLLLLATVFILVRAPMLLLERPAVLLF